MDNTNFLRVNRILSLVFQRYFILDQGLLTYGKGPSEIARGKIHGKVDIGLSVISSKGKRKRIDIDADEFIHHLKVSEFF